MIQLQVVNAKYIYFSAIRRDDTKIYILVLNKYLMFFKTSIYYKTISKSRQLEFQCNSKTRINIMELKCHNDVRPYLNE